MKIVLCHNYYQQAGGEDRVFHDEEQLLLSHGHEVSLFTMHNDSVSEMSRLGVATSAIWNGRTAKDLQELVESEQADIVHFHNTLPLISPAAYYAARSAGAAVVQSLHNYRLLCPKATLFRDGGVCEQCIGKSVPWPAVQHGCYRDSRSASATVVAMLSVHRLMRTYKNAVDRYIAMSEFSRQKLIEGGLPAKKIDLKPNFVSPAPAIGSGQGGYAMYLGRLSPEKGVETLLAAWQRLAGAVPLKVIGTGPLSDMVSQASRNIPGLEQLGWVSDREVERLLAEASFLVLPSVNYEGFPKTIVEAFSRGTPVVASKLGAMGELIEDGRNGAHFEAGNAEHLARTVKQLFVDTRRLSAMRHAAREVYETKYTADTNYETMMLIYETAMRSRNAKPIDADSTSREKPHVSRRSRSRRNSEVSSRY